MRMFGLKELAGEKFWQRLPLFIWVLNNHSAQHADSGLPVAHLLAKKSKGSSTGIDLHFFWSGLKTFLSCVFPPWPIFLRWFIFLLVFFKGWQKTQALPWLGFCTLIAPISAWWNHGHTWGQIPPGPPASHLTYRIRASCSGNFKGRRKSPIHIEIFVAWCLCVRHDEFSIRDLWCIYSCHKKNCSVASRSHLWVSPGMKFPQRVNKSFSHALGLWQGSAASFACEHWAWISKGCEIRSALWSHMELPVWAIAQCALYEQGHGFTLCGWGTCAQAKKQNINFIAYHISFPWYPPASLCWRSYKTLVLCQNTGDQQDFKAWFITHRTSKEKSQFPEFLFLISAFGVWPQLIFWYAE